MEVEKKNLQEADNEWRLLSVLSDLLNALGTILIGVMTLLICSDVLGRAFFGQPVRGVPELVTIMIVAVVYLQIASALKNGRWTMAELFIERLTPRHQALVMFIHHMAGALLFAMIAYAVWPLIRDAVDSGDFVGVQGIFTFPTWPVKATVLIGSAVTSAQFFAFAINHLRNIFIRDTEGQK
jgi:TRAP-type C4-dicarboxylate transport system permease small subunit